MKDNILILGASGMFGSACFNYFCEKKLNVYGIISNNNYLKFFNKKKKLVIVPKFKTSNFKKIIKRIEDIIKKKKITIVINALGYTSHKKKEGSRYQFIINSKLPNILKNICEKKKIFLIHFSTDCIFSGKIGNYNENDLSDTIENYGKYKKIGEIENSKYCCTLRTSGIGNEYTSQNNLLEWFLNLKQKNINGYSKAYFSGPTTLEIAKIIYKYFINKNDKLNGIYHIGSYKISKYNLLKLINKIFNTKKNIYKIDTPVIDRSLNSEKFRKKTKYKLKKWTKLIKELKQFSYYYK